MLGYTSVLLDLIGDDGALRDAMRLRPVKRAQQCLPCLHIDLPGSRVFHEADRPLFSIGNRRKHLILEAHKFAPFCQHRTS